MMMMMMMMMMILSLKVVGLNLDLSRLRDVIGHVNIRLVLCGFLYAFY